ncbi:invasion associated locus B family protein [Halomonas sp. M4R5S39]|uniref:Invasion associated locus B family protein n=1 Tax=Halomonas kalidii TaxID=3043293 RepID=A0ABT6VPM8_9GAMM|nr:invasion associated locus B family protein [Halomonas kalidii]MDI5935948.1 invasion associated locus B family protein [Halomonas kalidii]MDI5986796.1 invasion associated locus B family protein [Halomonas kalidii]
MSNRSTRFLCLAGLLSLLALAPHAFAQQAPPGAADADVTTEQFRDWEVVCPSEGGGNCTMYQVVNHPEGDQPLMQVVVTYPPQLDGPAMTFLLPLGVHLASGLQLSVDGVEPAQFPYQACLQQGCRADLPVEPALLEALRSGSTATLSLIDPRGDRMDLDISLMGFTDAQGRIAR